MSSITQAVAAVKPKAVVLREYLQGDGIQAELAKVCQKTVTPERLTRVLLTMTNQNPLLAECSQSSLYACLLLSAQYGVELDGRMAHAIPYKSKDGYQAKFQWDYKGLADIIRRSGEVADIHCDVVYEADEFEDSHGEGGRFFHRPNRRAKDRGQVYCAYSSVKMKDGTWSHEVMQVDEILKIRDNSQGWKAFMNGFTKDCPWKSFEHEMFKKTVFKRHTKMLPFSSTLKEAVRADDDLDINSDDSKIKNAKPITPTFVSSKPIEVNEEVSAPVEAPTIPVEQVKTEPVKIEVKEEPKTETVAAVPPIESLKEKMAIDEINETQVLAFLVKRKQCDATAKSLSDIKPEVIEKLDAKFDAIKADIKAIAV